MSNQADRVSIKQKQKFICALPIFSLLTETESASLASLMQEVDFQSEEVIVMEGTIVDSVFILIAGHAEVSHQQIMKRKISRKPKIINLPIAKLEAGEAVGLNDTGFFSTSGKRTASVTAKSKVSTLKLNLKELQLFLDDYPHIQLAIRSSIAHLLKLKMIKQSLPFNRLSHERLVWLAEKVEQVNVAAGEIIFSEGEPGDCCYLIAEGDVEIYTTDEQQDKKHPLAVLKTPTLFGEATMITHSPRNASACALSDCKLLKLHYDYLSELIESEDNVANTFMTLMVDRSRPLINPAILAYTRYSADGQEISILKNPEANSYFKLSKEGWFIWQQLNGKQSMQEITLALAQHFDIFAPEIVASLISKLARAGFVTQVEVNSNLNCNKQPIWVRMMMRVRRVLEARIAIGDADPFLSKVYNKLIRFVFTKCGQIILAIVAVLGIAAFSFSVSNILSTFQILPNTWFLLIILFPFTVLTVITHEFGHAFTVKAFGQEVHYMGVGWYWLGPIAFTDTSDMWLSTRWPRIWVNIAGVYTDVLFAGIASLSIFLFTNPYIQAALWLFSLFTYINAFRMLSPLQEWDGYYILMDLFDRPKLRQSAVLWLIKTFPKSLRQPKLFKKHVPEISYWLYCIVFLFLVSGMTFLLQTFVFKILGLKPGNIIVSVALPFLIVLISCLGIIADLRAQSENH